MYLYEEIYHKQTKKKTHDNYKKKYIYNFIASTQNYLKIIFINN